GDGTDDLPTAASNGNASHSLKLRRSGQPANYGVIADLHMAGQRAVVRKNNVISDQAIVRDVAIGEKGATGPDARFPFARCAATDCDKFTKCIFVSDFH